MSRHPKHALFVSMLQRYSISIGVKHKSKLADRLGVKQLTLHRWLAHGVMPRQPSLDRIAAETGIIVFSGLRTAVTSNKVHKP